MSEAKIPLWRNQRVLRIWLQIIVVLLVLAILIVLGNNLVNNFQQKNLSLGFDFLSRRASFDIGDKLIDYRRTDPYIKAILVGLLNSLRVMVVGIVLATFLGIAVGIGRLSNNWLVRQITAVYVEIFRNTPLLLQLFFWYSVVFLNLPRIGNSVVLPGSIYLSNRGINIPWPGGTRSTWFALGFLCLSVIIGIIIWRKRIEAIEQQASSARILQVVLLGIAIAATCALVWGLDWRQPQLDREASVILGGISFSPELATLLLGLTVYTAAYIAEVVRAGIQSVSQGQWEAAKALGLKSSLVMQMIIFPQALRVMIPPLTSEYLNLAKNSSLAIAIGYSDIYSIANTIFNNTGRSVEMLLIVIVVYLIINLIISLLMNWFNARVQLPER
ncbi:amino acid ABC transporter permease [Pleurocapsa sp. PCC 7319]|uniref:amino acid ABC transporter permease n=1 Tax=Pleurocapsa sp. PCC 7319 TaxID=118161 RepID=UPI00037E2BB8|nr:ABC transporter permease subunit [Pleurocapsa sp. PCC 7319]